MPVYDENDPKLVGYTSIEDYREKDMDRSSRRIRDMPYGRRKEDGALGPSEMNFGTVDIYDVSPAQTAVLHNKGYDDLPINGMSVVGDFLVTTDCGSSLKPGEMCNIAVQFNPKRGGILTGGIYVNTGDAAGTEFIKLRGSGELSDVPVDPIDPPLPTDDGGATTLPVISISNGVLETRSGVAPSFNVPSAPISLGSAAFGETAEGIFYLTGSSEGVVELETLPAAGMGFSFGFSTSAAGPFMPQTTFAIPLSGRMYVRARASGAPGDYARTVTFESATQTKTVSLTATVEEVIIPQSMKRIRVAGNQFYKAENEGDPWGVLPAEGGYRLSSVNWFGAEGNNYTPHGVWMVNWKDVLDQIKSVGFNCIRLPFSSDMVQNNPVASAVHVDFDINPDWLGLNALQIFDLIIEYCEEIELYVVLDRHRRQSGAGADGGPIQGAYNMARWIDDWEIMATRYKDAVNVVGADLHNEPHDLTWDVWAGYCETVGNAIHAITSDWIIFVEGVGNEGTDHYWWGGYLKGVATRPVVLTLPQRVAYSPHEYGQSVGSQTWQKKDGNNPAGWPLNQAAIWDQYWGFIFYENIAPIWIGEMGGHFGLDADTGALNKPHWIEETEWMSHLVRYLDWDENIDGTVSSGEAAQANGGKQGMSFAWWSWNPNSGDTGGIVQGDWVTLQAPKINLIQSILD